MKKIDTILMIDDDPFVHDMNKWILKRHNLGTRVVSAFSGIEGLQVLRDLVDENPETPILILLDINMRGMNGFEFLREFRNSSLKAYPYIHTIVLTSSVHPRDIITIESLGLKLINKPLTAEKISASFSSSI